MTPHPQRCETCSSFFEIKQGPQYRCRWTMHKVSPNDRCLCAPSYWKERKTPTPAAPDKCDWDEPKGMCAECEYRAQKPCDHCDFQEREEYIHSLESQIATIRNQTLDEVLKRLEKQGIEIHEKNGQRYYVVEGTFSFASLMQWLESLRTPSTQEHP